MKFSIVWRQTGDTWKLSRVLSDAHFPGAGANSDFCSVR